LREPQGAELCLGERSLYRFQQGQLAMALFIAGLATGVFLSVYLLIGTDRHNRSPSGDAASDHADKWKDQRPLPPF
jgi:hypothetical protein